MDNGPLTITDAAARIRRGELTPSELLEVCLARIDRYEPKVRAWVYLDRERATRDAERLTDELKKGQDRGPLHGIPVGVKDIIDVFDMPTGCGSKLWADSYARRDATVVERLRQAGAVILGKTVTTAFAYLDPPVTRNPWNLDRTPGGSSSGSAAAVACGMCLAALGSQTGGSITRPASYCGVYSLKPTWDRVSVDGVLPLAPSLDHVGVMANSVRDLSLVYRVVAGHMDYARYGGIDVHDPLTEYDAIPHPLPAWVKVARRRRFRPIHLQYTTDFFPDRCGPVMDERFTALLERLVGDQDLPRPIDPVVLPPGFGNILSSHRTVMASEAANYHRDRYRRLPDDYPPRIAELIEVGLSTPAADSAEAMKLRSSLSFEFRQRDMPRTLLVPATPGPPPTPETTGDPTLNSPWSFLGLPTVSLPFDWTPDGLPLAVQLVGEQFTEDVVLRTAEYLEEQITLPRTLPTPS